MTSAKALYRGVLAGVVFAMVAGTALAQGVGNGPSLPTSFNLGPAGWDIVDPSGLPIPVVLDPTGPAWIKDLNGPNGGPVVAPAFFSSQIHESLLVSGSKPWTDWHEDLLVPGWSWYPVSFQVNGGPASNLTISNTPGTTTTGGSISYFFDPVLPGSTVDILKRLVFDAGIPGTVYTGQIHVAEYPTPEPATMFLLAGGALALSRRRRRVAASC